MEFLEAADLFPGGHHGFFHRASEHRLRHGGAVLRAGFRTDPLYHSAHQHLRRPGVGLAFPGVHYLPGQRRTVVLYGHHRAVSGQDISGA